MQISLKPELAKFIDQQVQEGRYATTEDAINNAAVARLQTDEELSGPALDELRAEIDVGLADLDAGRLADFTAEDVIGERRAAFDSRRKGA